MAKVLLVEDEMLVRELAFEDLSEAGHDVTAASNGDEALALLRDERRFEILFTDIKMPGTVDGWQLAEEGRRLIPDLKVVYATGFGEDAQLDSEDRVLSKPYSKDDLLDAML